MSQDDIKIIINTQYEKYKLKIFDIEQNYKMAACSLNNDISNDIIVINQNSLIYNYYALS